MELKTTESSGNVFIVKETFTTNQPTSEQLVS